MATIKDDGTLGAFADAGVPLSAGQQHTVPAVVGNWLYLLGGDATNGSGQQVGPPVTDRAPIGGAALGPFADAGLRS